jgi:uncharacterized protein (DUF427 family)
MSNSGPGYAKHPDHKLELTRPGKRVQVTLFGEVIADSTEVIQLDETGQPPVFYFPRKHVKMERLVKTATHTHSPFLGDASYFSLKGASNIEDSAWSYEQPYDEMLALREWLAFYPNKVDSIRSD